MKLSQSSQNYVLVLDQDSNYLQSLELLMHQLRCSMVVAYSAAQAIATVSQTPPYLIILAGNQRNWSKGLVSEFRQRANAQKTTIVALTDSHAPSWLSQEENPGLDGFLVKPLNGDVLSSVVHSAWVRQTYSSYPTAYSHKVELKG